MMFSQYHNTHRKFKRLAKALIRLRVCVFAGRTYHIDGNLMSRLISKARRCTWQFAFGSRRYYVVT